LTGGDKWGEDSVGYWCDVKGGPHEVMGEEISRENVERWIGRGVARNKNKWSSYYDFDDSVIVEIDDILKSERKKHADAIMGLKELRGMPVGKFDREMFEMTRKKFIFANHDEQKPFLGPQTGASLGQHTKNPMYNPHPLLGDSNLPTLPSHLHNPTSNFPPPHHPTPLHIPSTTPDHHLPWLSPDPHPSHPHPSHPFPSQTHPKPDTVQSRGYNIVHIEHPTNIEYWDPTIEENYNQFSSKRAQLTAKKDSSPDPKKAPKNGRGRPRKNRVIVSSDDQRPQSVSSSEREESLSEDKRPIRRGRRGNQGGRIGGRRRNTDDAMYSEEDSILEE
jgi:hypothetical protein